MGTVRNGGGCRIDVSAARRLGGYGLLGCHDGRHLRNLAAAEVRVHGQQHDQVRRVEILTQGRDHVARACS